VESSTSAQTFGDVVVTAHHLGTQAALEILSMGGNAVDAAIAANATLGVCEPHTCGIGGDLFALVYEPGSSGPTALNASGRAGSGADPDTLRSTGETEIPWDHPLTATVPGCVDGWTSLTERYGSMPLSEALAPARRLAEGGFPASTDLAAALRRRPAAFRAQPSATGLYPRAEPQRGDRIRRADLARTLDAIGDGGRRAFYEGPPGLAISEATGSNITPEDLRRGQAEWIEPLALDLFGRTAWTIPPNTQGYLTLATAWIFEHLDPPDDPEDPRYVHSLIEAYRSLAWERDDLVADPDFTTRSPSDLVSTRALAARARLISDRARSWPSETIPPGGTTYLCVLDRRGLGISLIQSNFMGIGNGIAAGDQGFFLHNRGAGFNLIPGHPNELAPGKRPLHTLSPSIWTADGELDLILGTRGGHKQPQILAQVAAHLFVSGDEPGVAQARPRWTTADLSGSSRIEVEARIPTETVTELRRRGHDIAVAGPLEGGWGPVSMITVRTDGLRTGAPDPRVDTTSVGVG
jgi:gamma-glutamyltranspeptidase/glutathione hydrolase